METYYIRHAWSVAVDEKTREHMWNENRIFIHFPWDKSGNQRNDSKSTNPEDYLGGSKRAISALQRLASQGGYVCAHFVEHKEWLMGKVFPKSHIQITEGRWPNEFNLPKNHNGIAVIKTLLLHKVRRILPEDYVVLQPAQPRQGTIMRWPSIGNAVKAIVEREELPESLDALSPNHQEIMCAEFLRLNESTHVNLPRLASLLRDVGRTMKDLDIVGIAQDGKRILAQVTYSSFDSKNVQEKRELLQKFVGHDAYLILFCNCDKSVSEKDIIIYPIQEIYARFRKTDVGKNWFKQIFRRI